MSSCAGSSILSRIWTSAQVGTAAGPAPRQEGGDEQAYDRAFEQLKGGDYPARSSRPYLSAPSAGQRRITQDGWARRTVTVLRQRDGAFERVLKGGELAKALMLLKLATQIEQNVRTRVARPAEVVVATRHERAACDDRLRSFRTPPRRRRRGLPAVAAAPRIRITMSSAAAGEAERRWHTVFIRLTAAPCAAVLLQRLCVGGGEWRDWMPCATGGVATPSICVTGGEPSRRGTHRAPSSLR